MSGLVVKRLDSLAELRRAARAWDELWQRSETTLPTARAELVAVWCESFAAERPFAAFLVEDDGQAVAALPLVESRRLGFKAATLPGNHWSPGGDLLVDPQADSARICDALLRAVGQGVSRLLSFDGVRAASTHWQSLLQTLERDRHAHVRRERFAVDLVRIGPDWRQFFDSRSSNHRHHMRRAAARANREGPTELERFTELTPDAVEPLLRRCFEIEASGWKGSAGGAMLQSPRAARFYVRQASQLAAWGQLSVSVLTHRQRPIAFEYGWQCKGVNATPKVGYDEAFGRLSPGQLLRSMLIEQFHRDGGVEWLDFLGPSSPATLKWGTHRYSIDRIVASLGGPLAGSLVAAYRHARPWWRKIRRGGGWLVEPAESSHGRRGAAPADDGEDADRPLVAG